VAPPINEVVADHLPPPVAAFIGTQLSAFKQTTRFVQMTIPTFFDALLMPGGARAARDGRDLADAASVLRPRATDSVPDSFIELARCRVQPRLFLQRGDHSDEIT
jgi:hypothetical protein